MTWNCVCVLFVLCLSLSTTLGNSQHFYLIFFKTIFSIHYTYCDTPSHVIQSILWTMLAKSNYSISYGSFRYHVGPVQCYPYLDQTASWIKSQDLYIYCDSYISGNVVIDSTDMHRGYLKSSKSSLWRRIG